jgi:undecaprenyl diphosphate synthase
MTRSSNAKSGIIADGEGLIPHHVAIIMDGNGRWAQARLMPRIFGHNVGVEALRKVTQKSIDMGVKILSVYAFSTENWRRPKDEIDGLFALLKQFVKSDLKRLNKSGVRIRIQGQRDGLGKEILALIDEAEESTKHNETMTLVICFNYGGQAEILDAVKKIATLVKADSLNINEINIETFEKYLNSADWPHPDLIIRTAGEKRLSNFLMWQSAYSEFVFTDTLWPDFESKDFEMAIKEFQKRKRRFGGV